MLQVDTSYSYLSPIAVHPFKSSMLVCSSLNPSQLNRLFVLIDHLPCANLSCYLFKSVNASNCFRQTVTCHCIFSPPSTNYLDKRIVPSRSPLRCLAITAIHKTCLPPCLLGSLFPSCKILLSLSAS